MSGPPPDPHAFLTARPFAHRGLHGAGISENGMAAFAAAIAAGYGIECDVRASRDGVAYVFHDGALARMTGQPGRIGDRDAARIDTMTLPDGGGVPRLRALLDLAGTATPLLLEIKADRGEATATCRSVTRDLASVGAAPVAIMSFNPNVLHWFRRHAPDVVRGLVVTQQGKGKARGCIERALALWRGAPDFLACDIRDLPSSFATRAHRRGLPVLTWTVRTRPDGQEDAQTRAAAHADQIIFERAHD